MRENNRRETETLPMALPYPTENYQQPSPTNFAPSPRLAWLLACCDCCYHHCHYLSSYYPQSPPNHPDAYTDSECTAVYIKCREKFAFSSLKNLSLPLFSHLPRSVLRGLGKPARLKLSPHHHAPCFLSLYLQIPIISPPLNLSPDHRHDGWLTPHHSTHLFQGDEDMALMSQCCCRE